MSSRFLPWIPKLIAAVILIVAIVPKFTGGSAALADKLPGGALAVTAVGLAELAGVALLLVPATATYGAALVALLMLGAVGSHVVGPVGFDGEFRSLFVMAVVALGAALATLWLERR